MKNGWKHFSSEYAIYFDSRKDKTLIRIKEGERTARKTITEEHVVLLSEPGSKYVGHVTPISRNYHNIKTSILTFFREKCWYF